MDLDVDVMVLRTSIRSISDFVISDISKITHNLNFFDVPIRLHYLTDEAFFHFLETADEELSHQNTLSNFIRSIGLVFKLLLFLQRHGSQNL